MALLTFHQYLSEKPHKNQMNTNTEDESDLYALYISWITTKQKTDRVLVKELLFQLKVISCYIESRKIQDIVPEINYGDINVHISTLIQSIKEAQQLITMESNTIDFSSSYITSIQVASVISAIFIGSGFAPQLSIGGATALWAIGALIGCLALSFLKQYNHYRIEMNRYKLERKAYAEAENKALDLATNAIAPIVNTDTTPSFKNAITGTLKGVLNLHRDIVDFDQYKVFLAYNNFPTTRLRM